MLWLLLLFNLLLGWIVHLLLHYLCLGLLLRHGATLKLRLRLHLGQGRGLEGWETLDLAEVGVQFHFRCLRRSDWCLHHYWLRLGYLLHNLGYWLLNLLWLWLGSLRLFKHGVWRPVILEVLRLHQQRLVELDRRNRHRLDLLLLLLAGEGHSTLQRLLLLLLRSLRLHLHVCGTCLIINSH